MKWWWSLRVRKITCRLGIEAKMWTSASGRACVKTQTMLVAASYLYKFMPLHREFSGLSRFVRHKITPGSGPSAFSHSLGQTRPLSTTVSRSTHPPNADVRSTSALCQNATFLVSPHLEEAVACLNLTAAGSGLRTCTATCSAPSTHLPLWGRSARVCHGDPRRSSRRRPSLGICLRPSYRR